MAINSGLGADNVYVLVTSPQPVLPAGLVVSSGLASGQATWGPKDTPVSCNTPQALFSNFGPPLNSGRSLVQEGSLFLNQFPMGSLIAVRESDGTDAAATITIKDTGGTVTGMTVTGLYTGSFGNSISIGIAAGSNSIAGSSWKVTVYPGSGTPEVFDNIPAGTLGAAWAPTVAALTSGLSATRPKSAYVTAVIGSSVLQPVAGTSVLAGGADGSAPSDSALMGTDGGSGSRKGLYAGRGTGFDVAWICGQAAATTIIPTLLAFCKSENAYAIGNLGALSPTAAVTAALGMSDPNLVLTIGTVAFLDTYLNLQCVVPPAAVWAGVACSLPVWQPVGNRPVYGILGTPQTLAGGQPYGSSDLQLLEANGIATITAPIPQGNMLGTRFGKNSSSNFATSEISYTRQTNAYVRALQGPVLGQFVNRNQGTSANDPLRKQVLSALNGYFAPQLASNQISGFVCVCDLTNNSPASIASGVLNATILVQYMAVVNQFIVNITAGQTVTITTQTQALA